MRTLNAPEAADVVSAAVSLDGLGYIALAYLLTIVLVGAAASLLSRTF